MISAARQPDLLAQLEVRYAELLEGLSDLEARVATTLDSISRKKTGGEAAQSVSSCPAAPSAEVAASGTPSKAGQ